MSEARRPNQFPGRCFDCGSNVPAGVGTYEHGIVTHQPGDCNTKTKTWRDTEQRRTDDAGRARLAAVYTDAGYTFEPVRGFEPVRYQGHGLLAYVGHSRETRTDDGWELTPVGVEIHRDGALIFKGEQPPRPETGDYWADQETYARALVAMFDEHRHDAVASVTEYRLNHFGMEDARPLVGKTVTITEWDLSDDMATKLTYPAARVTSIAERPGPYLVLDAAVCVATDAETGKELGSRPAGPGHLVSFTTVCEVRDVH